ncbi:zinc finger BED domain-containing protein RICESLEEPER 2-like [Cucumis melo var. makuwa]|uniref:Zinc finger BED domain-containing protein RICESLEEPER 2-like n=1 Tax=Cucumis melo var. makuwa TaxID=1194695 RepID=A0A5D3C9B8_CUCMM|nr:zinc finger BED domain-containing protein RICESLEEPER 2-like [Cucumis melo var. makuwa]TYK07824.1 zinc finger BED domain-containing protein RICESLEEPER 2-like [Cucumis melo var. makuwa]
METSSGQHSETSPSLSPSPAPSTNNATGTVSSSKPPLPDKKKVRATKKTTSTVWDHFTKLEENSSRCTCNYCDKEYCCDTTSCGTSTLWKHLKNQCKKYPYKEVEVGQTILTLQTSTSGKSGSNFVTSLFSQQLCREACAKMIIVDELPFKFIENEGFRNFCRVACPKFDPPSRVTIAKDIYQLYLDEKKKLKSFLVCNSQRVCLTTDTWTSLQNVNYMVLTAHFIDSDWVLHKKILNFCQVANHKGETIGKLIESCLLEWGIDKVFSITVDNASSNDGAISYIMKRLRSWKTLILEGELLHMRCCAHVINLIVNEGLKEMHDSIACVRNAVRYVRSSPKRLIKFKTCVEQEKIDCKALVCLDVPTRWNSTYLMLEHALKFEKAFQILEEEELDYQDYFAEDEHGKKKIGPPSNYDWKNVEVFVMFLKVFYNVTNKISGSLYVTANSFFHEMWGINDLLIGWSNEHNSILRNMAINMKSKYDKYWGSIEKINKLVFLAVVLDPRYKLDYVGFCFGSIHDDATVKVLVDGIQAYLMRLYNCYKSQNGDFAFRNDLSGQAVVCEQVESSDSLKVLSSGTTMETDASCRVLSRYKRRRQEQNTLELRNDVDRYLSDPCEELNDQFDVLTWWKLNAVKYPILSKIAQDIFAVPVSTVASESAFSTGGRILDSFRSSLSPKTVEALICTQNWIRGKTTLLDLCPELEEMEICEKIENDNIKSSITSST